MIFKVLRKLYYVFSKIKVELKIHSYRVLSKGRIVFQAPYFIGKGLTVNSDLTRTVIRVGGGLRVRNYFNITIGKNGALLIGADCFFNNNCSINCLGKIEIGNDNQFGEGVLIYDHNHKYQDQTQLVSDQGYNIGEITIGNNCWIGSNVIILKDVTIGDNVVIGAGCIIHKSIPSDSVVRNQQNLLITQEVKL
jgi:acetyltransferase-like isoleucine patch superfamily enzyme